MKETTKRKAGFPEKLERNEEIYKKKMSGASFRKLSQEYDLSMTTLQKIVNRWRLRENK